MPDQSFLLHYRIRSGNDFRRVYERKCSAADNTIVVYADANGLEHPRLGLSVSRRVGGAVRRNHWKRLLREAFRLQREQLPAGIDLIIIPRPMAEPRLDVLQQSLTALANRLGRRLGRQAR